MAKDENHDERYSDGLALPPALPDLATSLTGTRDQALALQDEKNVPAKFRGAWFHETYDNVEAFDNQQEEMTWFTRSPMGGTIWGESVRQVFVVSVPENSKLYPTGNQGDKAGYEGDDALPDWWMAVGREDIPKLMVVSKHHTKDADKIKAITDSAEYQGIRKAASEKLLARMNRPPD